MIPAGVTIFPVIQLHIGTLDFTKEERQAPLSGTAGLD
jgi:hypothetical protein